MTLRIPLGQSDFESLRLADLTYVDKTHFIAEVIADTAQVQLFTRPRRFGKTLNLTTLRAFFDPPGSEGRRPLFDGLSVVGDAAAMAHFGQHPCIWLTFKDVKASSWAAMVEQLQLVLAQAIGAHDRTVADAGLSASDRGLWHELRSTRAREGVLAASLRMLMGWLHEATGRQVVVLIDEYDSPLHAAWLGGFWDEAATFFRLLLGSAFKDDPHLYRGVLTGILRVGKESMFSGLNNLSVSTVLDRRSATAFGFTEEEVVALVSRSDQSMDELRAWYNGYRFGDAVIYNPWSVLSQLHALGKPCGPWWVNTGGHDLLERVITTGGDDVSSGMTVLLSGGAIRRVVDDSIVLRELDVHPESTWTLLLHAGYLRPRSAVDPADGSLELDIPNREVAGAFAAIFRRLLKRAANDDVDHLLRALLRGDAAELGPRLQDLVLRVMSFHDTARGEPERVFHAFVLGLLVWLQGTHQVVSNRESGYGRADVLVIPRRPGDPGVAMEFKRPAEGETLDAALQAAVDQLQARDYAAVLRDAGARPIHLTGVAADGKRVRVRVVVVTEGA